MKNQILFLLSLAVFLLGSCSSTQLFTDYEKGTNFSQYKSYKIAHHAKEFPVGANPINQQRIERAIEKEMKALGYRHSRTADLHVSWFVKMETKRSIDTYRTYYRRWRTIEHIDVYTYKLGTLVIDLIDPKDKRVVWHGALSGVVQEEMADAEEKINKAVKAIFEAYEERLAIPVVLR